MLYVVEVDGIEVFVELIRKGDYDSNTDPFFEVNAGTDWEGIPYPLTAQEAEEAILWVMRNYEHEVYN
jgi:hypothetical protein